MTITLLPNAWSGDGPYMQTVKVKGCRLTARSLVDLHPTADQVAQLIDDGVVGMTTKNTDGVLVVYALGGTPSEEMTIRVIVKGAVGKSGSERISWVGDVPTHSGSFFVDANNRMYSRSSSGNKLIVQDGLTGDVIDNTEDCYSFTVYETCAAYKTASDQDTYRVIMPDGTISGEIAVAGTRNQRFRYHNNLILHIYGSTTYYLATYDKTGEKLHDLKSSNRNPLGMFPLNAITAVGISQYSMLYGQNLHSAVVDLDNITTHDIFVGYSTFYTGGSSVTYLKYYIGVDKTHVFAKGQLTDPEDTDTKLDEWVIVKFPLSADWSGEELVIDSQGSEPIFVTNPTLYGTFVYRTKTGSNYSDAVLMNSETFEQIYEDELPTVPATATVQENDTYLWINGVGIYKKIREEDYSHDAGIAESLNVGVLELSAEWSGSGPYTQTVTLGEATIGAGCKIDLQPTAAQIESLTNRGVSGLTIKNENGTLTAYALGSAPSEAMEIQATVTEVR